MSRFDSIGLSLLVITMVCWEVMLSKGEEWNWLGDAFGRVQTLAALFVLAQRLLQRSRFVAERCAADCRAGRKERPGAIDE